MTDDKKCTNEVLEFIEEPIHKLHRENYIITIEKFYFHLAHIQILRKNEYGATRKEATISSQPYGYIRDIKYDKEK